MKSDTTPKQKERLDWVDWMKGAGILAVVYGHTPGLEKTELHQLIFSFHMPLFFILAGIVQKTLPPETTFFRYLKYKANKRLVPYLAYGLVGFVVWFLLRPFGTSDVWKPSILEGLFSIVYGQPILNMALWFYVCLFASELLAYPFYQVKRKPWIIGITCLAAGLGIAWPWFKGAAEYWSLQSACVALPFLLLGHFFKPFLTKLSQRRGLLLASVPILFGLTFYSSKINGGVDMRSLCYGSLPMFYLSALAGFFLTLATASIMRVLPFMPSLGRFSNVIFPIHLLLGFFLFRGFAYACHFVWPTGTEPLWTWLIFIPLWIAAVWVVYKGFGFLAEIVHKARSRASGSV